MRSIKLTEEDIQEWIEERSYERGIRYFKHGAIISPRWQGMTLKAYCQGSQPWPYQVSVTFDDDGISSAHCSCPVGSGGRCKHVAALLLTYLNRPEDFREVEGHDTVLSRFTKEELIELIKVMLELRPELAVLLDGGSGAKGKKWVPIEITSYRQRVSSAFSTPHWNGASSCQNGILQSGTISSGWGDKDFFCPTALFHAKVLYMRTPH